MKEEVLFVVVCSTIATFLIIYGSVLTFADSSVSTTNATLRIYDDSDSLTQYTQCTDSFCTQKNKIFSLWDIRFFANYTNASSSPLNSTNGNGSCDIRFNETGIFTSWFSMNFNSTSRLFEYNRSFTYKGTLNFTTNCTSNAENFTLSDTISITNTDPYVIKTAAGYLDFDADLNKDTLQCTEDSVCIYNFSANVSEDDRNDALTFNYSTSSNTTLALSDFVVNISTGIVTINVSNTSNTGLKTVELTVDDNVAGGVQVGLLEVNITAVNDAPYFTGLSSESFNISSLFNRTYNTFDEESNLNFTFNITFVSCSVAPWSTRNCSTDAGKQLFNVSNSSHYIVNSTALQINFTPERNDVGNYTLIFNVADNLGSNRSYNVSFNVSNINTAPTLTYVCDSERRWNETNLVSCLINASDVDETLNLTFSSNYSWFTFNNASNMTGSNLTSVGVINSGNASVRVNFTANDTSVGFWYVNITVMDSGAPQRQTSQVISFNISNTNDSVSVNPLSPITFYTTNNYTVYLNASDDDLLVPDKNMFNENITFSANVSWITPSSYFAPFINNYTTNQLAVNPALGGIGSHYVNISVRDSNNYSSSSFIWNVSIQGNSPPSWNSTIQTNHSLVENTTFYLNLSNNVTDADNNTIIFTYHNLSSFSSFNLNRTTGVINFTPVDADVGYQLVIINATDGNVNASLTFNFSVGNINDRVSIYGIDQGNIVNITINSTSSAVNTTEDAAAQFFLLIEDDDFRIPDAQRAYYNETHTINLTIQGPNTRLFNLTFRQYESFNRSRYLANFTANRSDVGVYNISINVSDLNNTTAFLRFNLTIAATNHNPVITSIANQTSSYNRTLTFNINVTDAEDGNDSVSNLNFTFSYSFLTGSDFIANNLTIFNTTSGFFNITFNDTQVGSYRLNISVNDSQGFGTSTTFWIFVYDVPRVLSPASGLTFVFGEQNTSNVSISLNHTIADNLTTLVYFNEQYRSNFSHYGNITNMTFSFTPNYTDETYSSPVNLTFLVINPYFASINTTRIVSVNVTHANAPVNFSGVIPDKSEDYTDDITINLSIYFTDLDFNDVHHNQTVSFNVVANGSNGSISYNVSNSWILTMTAPAATSGVFNISANDSQYTAWSNSFSVEFTEPTVVAGPTTTSGGGGGGQGKNVVLLKLILPDPITLDRKDRIILPITILNSGTTLLNDITLTSTIARNGTLRPDISSSFDVSHFATLDPGAEKKVSLTIETDTEELGLFEITVNASVKTPLYRDWGKIYLTVKEGTRITDRIVFTEEFIVGNPECAEIQELVDDARRSFDQGDLVAAQVKVEEALASCKRAIAQKPLSQTSRSLSQTGQIVSVVAISSLGAFIVGFLYYSYRRIQLRRVLQGREEMFKN